MKLIYCAFNLDNAIVELKYSDGSALAIDTNAVENEFAETRLERMELDYLIYNDPCAYADLILNGDVRAYLRTVRETESTYDRNNKLCKLIPHFIFGVRD